MDNGREVVVLSGVRTAIGDYGGSLKDVAPIRPGGACGEGSGGTRQDRAGRSRARGARQRHPHRAQGHVHLARGHDQRRPAQGDARADAEPPVRQRAAGHHFRGPGRQAGRCRRGGGRGCRVDEPRRLCAAHRALGRTHGQRRSDGHDGGRAHRSLRHRAHGHHRRERGRQVGHLAPAAGRAGGGEQQARDQRHGEGLLQGADSAHRAEGQEGPGRRRHRRASARGREHGRHGQAAHGVPEGRHGHRRQRERHQ